MMLTLSPSQSHDHEHKQDISINTSLGCIYFSLPVVRFSCKRDILQSILRKESELSDCLDHLVLWTCVRKTVS